MKNLTLYRYDYLPTHVCGLLFFETLYLADTLELPDQSNASKVSCIPEGYYGVKQIVSPHNGDCLSVINVPNRSNIEIHSGNTVADTEGCILVGVKSEEILLHSRIKLATILRALEQETGFLEIKRL